MSNIAVWETTPPLNQVNHPFLVTLIEQFRHYDTTATYCHWSDERLLNSLILSPSASCCFSSPSHHQSLILKQLQITAFYQAVAQKISEKTEHFPQVFLTLRDQQLSSALIFCGHLLVIYDLFTNLNDFTFDSLDMLIKTGEILVYNATLRINNFF